MPPHLPSLNALRAFEATARHRSISRAAAELGVTHGAVSRQIKLLEEVMGVSLLMRGTRESVPTRDGAQLVDGLSTAFNLIHATIERLKPGPLTLSCSASITMCWLIPRMPGLYARHPGMEIKLDMNYDRVDFTRDNISVAIRNNTFEPPKSAVIRPLGTEWIGPVCSPAYLKSISLKKLKDLSNARLLATTTRPNAWTDWLAAVGEEERAPQVHQRFDHFYLMIQAATFGLGIAVVPHMLAIGDLESGRLIAPFGFVPGKRQLSLWIAPHLASRSDLKTLEKWLSQELRDGLKRASKLSLPRGS
ncbi:LysR substrate-binding domain-containing protein [Bradyrhizobium sp. CCGE-LA001]|uniref:LysR substrate-binding domain-containing protein n=1 Tax=Bradyrhizobium sp. CCGE-LA001 TaxID=1223566 RepID=UPI000745E20D|nr:LysR substrate-binding domain-containing protein [Bradyrhizobium sp. CCGE-LA001]AMA56849.1 LysR family transcriptional regulator [Bradyrhizobium sp. CCGE-LA001]